MSLAVDPNLIQIGYSDLCGKENGESATCVAPKDGLTLESGPSDKALDGRSQVSTPHVGNVCCPNCLT